jgi:hypothetical protein
MDEEEGLNVERWNDKTFKNKTSKMKSEGQALQPIQKQWGQKELSVQIPLLTGERIEARFNDIQFLCVWDMDG